MRATYVIIPVLFVVSLTIIIDGFTPFLQAGGALYGMVSAGDSAASQSDEADARYVQRVSEGARGFEALMAARPPDTVVRATSDLLPQDNEDGKPIILAFDDAARSQYQFVRPIIDEFGFRATFFITCNFVQPEHSDNNFYMTWQEVADLQNDGQDVESHSMMHRSLNSLSSSDLEYEVGGSKKCLEQHGINATVFATPYNDGWDNSTVIDSIASHYAFAKNGVETDSGMFLRCDGWDPGVTGQTDCRTFGPDGQLNYANRYSIKTWSHNYYDQLYASNHNMILQEFAKAVEMAGQGDSGSFVLLEYHGVADIDGQNANLYFNTDPYVFYSEMKYLYDNGFSIHTMSDLGYDSNDNSLYLKDPPPEQATADSQN